MKPAADLSSVPDAVNLAGWIKLWRAILHHRLWELPSNHFKVAITILLLVGRKPTKVWNGREEIALNAGERLTSQDDLAAAAGGGITRRVVRRALKNLQTIGFLRVRRSTICKPNRAERSYLWSGLGIVVTVLNWERYQGNDDEAVRSPVRSRSLRGPFAVHKQEVENVRSTYSRSGSKSDVPTPVHPAVVAAFIDEHGREPDADDRGILADLGGFPIDAVRAAFREAHEKNKPLLFAAAVLKTTKPTTPTKARP